MPTAADSGTDAAGEPRLISCTAPRIHMAPGGRCWLPRQRKRGDGRNESPRNNRSSLDEPPLWADVPADILGAVLRRLPCLADRASVRSVCRHWRATARIQGQGRHLPAPLPVLVQPTFRLSCLTSDGRLTAARRAAMPAEVAGDDVQVVGSSDDWLMAVRPSRRVNNETDGDCFLVHAFSGEVVHLPRLSSSIDHRSALPSQPLFFDAVKRQPWLNCKAALSASPSSGSKYTVAASVASFGGLILWQPGMTSWYLCTWVGLDTRSYDLAFYQGKLYLVTGMLEPKIIALELMEDEHGVSVSCPEHHEINQLLPSKPPTNYWMRCNMVLWRGKLLLIVFFCYGGYLRMGGKRGSAEVFALDFSTSPCGLTQIHNFDGDCIFVDTNGCKSFSPGSHVGVQGDLIYFSDEPIFNHFAYTNVYNMRDGTVRRFAAPLIVNTGVQKRRYLDFPVWMCPSS